MKEIVAKRSKKSYVLLLIISVISIIISVRYVQVPLLQPIIIAMIVILSLASVLSIFFLVDPRGIIEKDGNTLIIRRGLFKSTLNTQDIIEVFLTPHPNNNNEVQKNCVSIKAVVEGNEKTIVCGDVMDAESVLKTLNDLINKT